MKLNTIYGKKTVISFEIFPPKHGAALQNIDETLEILCSLKPAFISVTFGAGGSTVNSKTVEIAKKIKEVYRVEPVVHLSCLNYMRSEILAMLEELREAGIENILALRGDRNPDVTPREDFHYASDLIRFIREQTGDEFNISAACYPETHPEAVSREQDILRLKEKVDNGAAHLISQLFFDNTSFYQFLGEVREAGIAVPVEAGIMPVTNKAQIERMVNLCGATLPEKYRKIMDRYENSKDALFDAGVIYALNQVVDLIANGVDGVHLYTMNNPVLAKRICDEIKNLI